MRCLVTGASGHIGNTLIRTLLEQRPSWQIRALVVPNDPALALDGLAVEIVRGDVLDDASLDAAMQGVEIVFHLAAMITIRTTHDARVEQVNIEGPVNVARAALRAGVRRMVHVASIHIFERILTGIVDENVPLVTRENAVGLYDYTKAEAVRRLRPLIDEGLEIVFACPTGVFGPNDYLGSEYGQVIQKFAQSALQFVVQGGYDWVDVRDVALGLMALAERGETGALYLLGGHYCTMHDFIMTMGTVLERRYRVITAPYGLAWLMAQLSGLMGRVLGYSPRLTPYSLRTIRDNANIGHAKASAALGHNPRPTAETLRDTLAWYREHGR